MIIATNSLIPKVNRPLTPLQNRFCDEYMVDFKEERACLRAGYSESTARKYAYMLMRIPKIVKRLNELAEEWLKIYRIARVNTVRIMTNIIEADVAKLFDHDGNLKPVKEIDLATRRAIAGIDYREETLKSGTRVKTTKIRMVDKPKTIELLAKHQQLLTDTVQLSVNTQVITLPAKVPIGTPVQVDDEGNIISE